MPTPIESIPEVHPLDEHNQLLVSRVHPQDWQNPEPSGRYHLVVIGAGSAGLVTAIGAAGVGARVALIEKSLMGGDCLNSGCVPSKALLRAARAIVDVRDAERFGVLRSGGVSADFGKVMERMRRLRAGIGANDSVKRYTELGVDVYLGQARFTGPRQLQVGDTKLDFAKACIASGSRASMPPIPGLKEADPLTNATVFTLTELPRRLLILGAGPIGSEMAQAFARFGSEVTMVGHGPGVLAREDRDASELVERSMQQDGIKLMLDSSIARVSPGEGGALAVEVESMSGGGTTQVPADRILVAAGRTPNVEGLDMEAAGVEYDPRTGVKADDRLRTTNRRIYAAGDICTPYKFTHMADAMARIVVANALFFGRSKASALTLPWCTYTDPELARVGLNEAEAAAKNIAIDTYRTELDDVDRAILDGESEGFVKIHCKRGTDKILGATIVARHAGEMISEITAAMTMGQGLGSMSKTIHPYPTQADAVRRTAFAQQRTRLTPRAQSVLKAILRLQA